MNFINAFATRPKAQLAAELERLAQLAHLAWENYCAMAVAIEAQADALMPGGEEWIRERREELDGGPSAREL